MKIWTYLLALAVVFAVPTASPAATLIAFTFATDEADFVQPKSPGVISRQYVGSGTFVFNPTLRNGVYGIGDLASFNLDLRIVARIVPLPFADITADFRFGLADLASLSIIYSGGVPTSAVFTTNPKSIYQSTNNFMPFPASLDFVSSNDRALAINAFPPGGSKTTFAMTEIDATITNTGVPEPESWVTMIAGLALVGGALRQRSMRVQFMG